MVGDVQHAMELQFVHSMLGEPIKGQKKREMSVHNCKENIQNCVWNKPNTSSYSYTVAQRWIITCLKFICRFFSSYLFIYFCGFWCMLCFQFTKRLGRSFLFYYFCKKKLIIILFNKQTVVLFTVLVLYFSFLLIMIIVWQRNELLFNFSFCSDARGNWQMCMNLFLFFLWNM